MNSENNQPSQQPIDERVVEKLRKILALTESPEENEAASAAEMLQKFLVQYNLSVADLERKGAKAVAVTEQGIDLGKAAFTWKLDLAESIAEFYFCVGIVSRYSKTITFVGRPENVESLKMLYLWVLDQIKRLAAEERKKYQAEHGEHMDPLRWQVNFGAGAGRRLIDRLDGKRRAQGKGTQALVLHHATEISNYTEQKYGERYDGRKTKREEESDARYAERSKQWEAERKAQREADAALLNSDPKAYYEKYPDRHPEVVAAEERRQQRNYVRRQNYVSRGYRRYKSTDWRKEEQADAASNSGHKAADRINLDPFLTGKTGETQRIGKGK